MYKFQSELRPPSDSKKLIDWAVYYGKMGLVITPVSPGGKNPIIQDWNKEGGCTDEEDCITKLWEIYPNHNIGCVLGFSGICVLDIDAMDQAKDIFTKNSLRNDMYAEGNICWSSGKSGRGKIAFLYPDGEKLEHFKYKIGKKTVFELRCGPLQDVLPPSIHPSSTTYKWVGNTRPWQTPIQPLPEELLAFWKKCLESYPDRGNYENKGKSYTLEDRGSGNRDGMQEKILERVDLDNFLVEKGVVRVKESMYLCPFHDERKASFWTFSSKAGNYRLWECSHGDAPVGRRREGSGEFSGNVIHMYQFFNKIDSYGTALRAMAKELGIVPDEVEKKSKREKNSDSYLEFIEDLGLDYFLDNEGNRYASIDVKGNIENLPLTSEEIKLYIRQAFSEKYSCVAKTTDVKDIVSQIDCSAYFSAPILPVSIRVGEDTRVTTKDVTTIYLDTVNATRDIIRITAEGNTLIGAEDCPIRFRRSKTMLPLPDVIEESKKEDLLLLKDILNVTDEGFIMVVAWMLFALNPRGPFPILTLQGEQGTAKSTATRIIRSLVDPSTIPLRHLPAYNKEEDLFITAKHNWVNTYENVSGLSVKMSDAICTLSTGSGYTKRKLYTDDEEVYLCSKRPQIINGIESLLTKGDQADRTLIVELQPISERKDEAQIDELFRDSRDLIFTALLEATTMAIRNIANTPIIGEHRMADFCKWIIAAEECLPWEKGAFLRIMGNNKERVTENIIEGDPVALAIVTLMEQLEDSSLTLAPLELLTRINLVVNNEAVTHASNWPKTAWHLSNRITRIRPLLRVKGIQVTNSGNHHKRTITLQK